MNKKKKLIFKITISGFVCFCFLILGTNSSFIWNKSNMINILLILIGFALTSYTFIYSPLSKIISKLTEQKFKLELATHLASKTLKSIKENITIMAICVAIIIFIDTVSEVDIPFILDTPTYLVPSLKNFILDSVYIITIVISAWAVADIAKGLFIIVESSFGLLQKIEESDKGE